MTDFTGEVPGKRARPRRGMGRVVILAMCVGLSLTFLVSCCAIAVAVLVVVTAFNGIEAVFNGLFSGLFGGVAMFFLAIALGLLAVFPLLMELLALLSTGQLIPFFMRLAQLLGSS